MELTTGFMDKECNECNIHQVPQDIFDKIPIQAEQSMTDKTVIWKSIRISNFEITFFKVRT